MRVEIKLDAACVEPHVVICASALTDEIHALIGILESDAHQIKFLTAKVEDRLFVIDPKNIEIVRTESGILAVYDTQNTRYTLHKALHEVLAELGTDFVQISKSSVVNIRRIDHITPSFNGVMDLVMKNGVGDYISRKYLKNVKIRLGL